jgi:hypothetical protein
MTRLKTRLGQMAVAALLSTGLLAVALADSADATSHGKNGMVAFESNRTTGKDVDNPTGNTGIFTVKPDGTDLEQPTRDKADDFSPAFSAQGEATVSRSKR